MTAPNDDIEPVDCDDEPKLTADEWAYIEAMTAEGGS